VNVAGLRGRGAWDRGVVLLAVVALLLGCATLADLSAAGEALQDAGHEVHELMLEEGGLVRADLERPDGSTEDDDLEGAAAIIWEHTQDRAEEVEVRLRGEGDTDRIRTFSTAELQELPRTGS